MTTRPAAPGLASVPGACRIGVCAAAALLVGVAPAAAQRWSLDARFSQTLSAETNRDLDTDGNDPSFGSTTVLGTRIGYETPRARWSLGSSIAIRAFTGGDDDDDLDVVSPTVGASMSLFGRRWSLANSLSFSRQNATFTQLGDGISLEESDIPDGLGADTGDTAVLEDGDATRTAVSFGSSTTFTLTPRNSISFGANLGIVRFSEEADTLEDSNTYSTSATFTHRVSQRTALTLGSSISRSTVDDLESTVSTGGSVTVGFQRTVSPRLEIAGNGGVTITRIGEDQPNGFRDTSTTVSGTGSFGVLYREGETAFNLSLAQSVRPDADGDISNVTSLSAGFTTPLTSTQSVSVTGGLSRSSTVSSGDGSETDLVAEIGPTYSLRLTDDWSASLGYRLRFGNDDNGSAVSNGVFLSVSRPLQLFP
ncbi:MAG: hypothetical protein AAF677_04275 [Pseudomonadota bacterium]